MIDKTGTLTEGKPNLVTLESADAREDLEVLRLLASLEQASEHPLAGAIISGAKERKLQLAKHAAELSDSSRGRVIRGQIERVCKKPAAI